MGILRRQVRKRVRKPARQALRRVTRHWCPQCQKHVRRIHTCVIKTDFKRRKSAAARRVKAARRRQRKAEAAARRKAAAAARRTAAGRTPRRQARTRTAHDYLRCRDDSCQRPQCVAYRDGQQACPLPHQ